MDLLTIIIVVLALGYLSYVIIEKVLVNKLRKSFKLIIHVNGIRGKSTTTRLIDAGLRNCGFKVFSKTTGTVPTYIDVNNNDKEIMRLGKANIREQIKMLRLAKKEGAEVVVLECMAVNPELQRICEEKILKADVTVITNVRLDHVNDMGDNLEDIAEAFSNTIPTNGKLIIADSEFANFFKDKARLKNTEVFVSKPYDGEDLDTFKENISLSLMVAEALNLDQNSFFEGMRSYHHDVGAFDAYKINDTIFFNGFSINDPTSIKIVYDKIINELHYQAEDITILLNNRFDRPTRVIQHIDLMKEIKYKNLYLTGSNLRYVKNKIAKDLPNIDIRFFTDIDSLLEEKIIFAVGNIGGKGLKILDYFKNNGEKI